MGRAYPRWTRVTLVLAMAASVFVAPAARATTSLTFTDSHGIHVVGVTQLDDRQYNVKVLSPALGRAVDVRILVPGGYNDRGRRRYPVLYLFHGTSGRASDWVKAGDAEKTTAKLPLITVMPDAGFDGDGGGWFTNWVDTKTVLGPSQWETFHVDQLIPWVDANLRTVANRRGRAIAGLSQGGFGSTTYPARHPDMFVSAASFSGAPDIDFNPVTAAGATAIIEATAAGLDGVEPEAMFGPRSTDEINWQGHDPADLATNLSPVDLWLYTATGAPGPLDPPQPNPGAMGIEAATHGSTESFVYRAQLLGVPFHLVDYTFGTHSWPYWARDLREYVGPMMRTFARPPAAPKTISYQSIDKHWTQWGWSVDVQRPEDQQFTRLTSAGTGGFTLQGTGTATVVTPPFYRPGSKHAVTIAGKTSDASADRDGRLRLTVSMGGVTAPAVIGEPDVQPVGGATTVAIAA